MNLKANALVIPLFLFLSLFMIFFLPLEKLHSIENDQYVSWGREIQDSGDIINDYLNSEFNKAIKSVNGGLLRHTCQWVTHRIGWRFARRPLVKTDIWADNNPDIDKFPLERNDLRYDGIYRDIKKKRFTGRNINVSGINIGVDKLSHAIVMGYVYWVRYRMALKKYKRSHTPLEAEELAVKAAVRVGIWFETKLSSMPSYSDLEANFQGFLLYKNLCNGPNRSLKWFGAKRWALTEPVNFKSIVNPYFNEIFNPSYHPKKEWSQVEPYLKEYCTSGQTKERFEELARYQAIAKKTPMSFSMQYINSLIAKGTMPDPRPQRLDHYCLAQKGIAAFMPFYTGLNSALTSDHVQDFDSDFSDLEKDYIYQNDTLTLISKEDFEDEE
ncbi:MAG: hypothetical protein HQK50_09110 [Oligoflexia bacterium]|nr:hypothetical protein [Oligoflexia bacterium]